MVHGPVSELMHSTRRQTCLTLFYFACQCCSLQFILEYTNRSKLDYSSSLLINWESFLGPEIAQCCVNVCKFGFRYCIIHWKFLLNYIPYRAPHTWFKGLHIHRFQFTSPLLHNFPLQSCS